jgi:hypothetical protein
VQLTLSEEADQLVASRRSASLDAESAIEQHLHEAQLDLEAVQATALGIASTAQAERVASREPAAAEVAPPTPQQSPDAGSAASVTPRRSFTPYALQPEKAMLSWITNWESAVRAWSIAFAAAFCSLVASSVVLAVALSGT